MIRQPLLIAATVSVALGGCSSEAPSFGHNTAQTIAVGSIQTGEGKVLGNVTVTARGSAVVIEAAITGSQSAIHAFHLHETGRCDAPGFTSAGGHLNPDGRAHGKNNSDGAHLGDLPNIEIAQDGNGKVTATLDLSPEDFREIVFDADGTAVMVHEGPDDYVSDPAGAAGPRIGCAILKPSG